MAVKSNQGVDLALEEASYWFALLASGDASDKTRKDWQIWLNANQANAYAWQQIEKVNGKFVQVTMNLGVANVKLPNPSRRLALKQLSIVTTAGLVSWYAYREQPWQSILADVSTSVGERQQLTLADGTLMHVNTDSLVNIVYTDQVRLLKLLKGEVYIETSPDAQDRPFKVQTQHGFVTALGTRFTVRDFGNYSQASLFEGDIRINPQNNGALQANIHGGQQIRFNADNIYNVEKSHLTDAAWTKGLLVVYEMPLQQLTQELSRYRNGYLRCDANVANLKISGTLPIQNTNEALRKLAETFPVKIEKFTKLWVTIRAK